MVWYVVIRLNPKISECIKKSRTYVINQVINLKTAGVTEKPKQHAGIHCYYTNYLRVYPSLLKITHKTKHTTTRKTTTEKQNTTGRKKNKNCKKTCEREHKNQTNSDP